MSNTISRRIGSNNIGPEVELFGDWAKAKNLLRQLPRLIKEGSDQGQRAAANQLKRVVRRNIRNNGATIGWAPLSDSYKKLKKSWGFSPDRIYYASGSYYRNIKVWKVGKRMLVGVKPRTISGSSKKHKTLGFIARVLESGSVTRNIPPRPLWSPSYKQFGGGKRAKGYITWHIKNHIHHVTGVKPKLTIT